MACFAALLVLLSGAFTLVSFVHCRGPECNPVGRAGSRCLAIGWGLLVIGLASFFGLGVAEGIRGTSSTDPPTSVAYLVGCGALFWAALLAVGSILGIIAVVQTRRGGATPRARGQARWTLAAGLSGVLALALAVVESAVDDEENPVWAATNLSRRTLDFPDLNFRYTAPPAPWVQMDAQRVNPDAVLMFRLRNPDALFYLIAEPVGIQLEITVDGLAELASANARGQYPGAEIREEPKTAAGLDGLLLRASFTANRTELFLLNWVASHNGFAYQILLQGETENVDKLEAALDGLLDSFEVIDPSRFAHADGFTPAEDYESTRFGYSAKFGNSAWSKHTESNQLYADYAVQLSDEALFQVFVISLDGEDPSLDYLAQSMTWMVDVNYAQGPLENWREIAERGMSGVEFEHETTIDGFPSRDIVRLLKGERFAYMFAAWDDGTGPDDTLRDALSRVSLQAAEPPPLPTSVLTEQEKSTHEEMWFRIGDSYEQAGEPEAAARFFRRAFELDWADTDILSRLAHAYIDSGQSQLAQEYLQAMSSLFPENSDVQAHLALAQASAGSIEASVQTLSQVFALESALDEKNLQEYVELLTESAGLDPALRALSTLRDGADSENLSLLQASLLAAAEDHSGAIAVLQAWRANHPFSPRVSQQLVEHCYQSGEYELALELCEELVREGHDTAKTLYQRGRIEFVQEKLKEALVSLEAAAAKAPSDASIAALLAAVRAELKKR